MNNIYLIGYRATGKSSVSQILGKRLGKKVIHMDQEIIRKCGRIDLFVKNNGWCKFRDIETALLKSVSHKKDLIVDCGGGIIERKANKNILKNTGTVVWLKASASTIAQRLRNGSNENRPSLTGTKSTVEEVEEVLRHREELYRAAADFQVNTNGRLISAVANEIIELLK